ncbi:polysaccharide biosynthesis tyrosine autokinase [Lutimonas halocynthiae]|uniref:GumC family protein n=1 Tax=Lutimonas halocynthiae TaxID=1446477 RepID=UPI0025B5E451|nr:tyrosine-protein kinase domain-containing protein [Lutimonas halocynthiae]MDN3643393.1 polysaccharide biosynthesis tyrosine autokinase [Lutimonas halocynthiae]
MAIGHFSDKSFDNTKNFKQVIEKYATHYRWFIASVLFFGIVTFITVQTMTPKYFIGASILIKEIEQGKSISDLSSFEDLGLFGSEDRSLENEIQILKSRNLMHNVVKELKLNVLYYIEDSPYDKEQYPNFPLLLTIHSSNFPIDDIKTEFRIKIISATEFEFVDFDDNSLTEKTFKEKFQANLGNDDFSNESRISINLNPDYDNELIGETVLVKMFPVDRAIDYFMTTIGIKPINEKLSRVLNISLEESIKEKGIAIINNLIEQYNADGMNDKNLVAQATTDFLDLRLELISNELITIEGTAEQFKSKNQMLDSEKGANYYLESSSLNERDLVAANTQMQLISYMLEELDKRGRSELLPGNIGLSDVGIINLISEYNELVLQRNRVMKSSSVRNPIIVGIDSQLEVLKKNLSSSLSSLKSSSEIQIRALNTQGGKISSRIASVPRTEREFKDIVRQQETKNALYLFLLQKREESILSNAVNVEKAKVIDRAYSNGLPVYPKKGILYVASILFGFLLPVGIIYIKNLLDTKVHDENDISRLGIPYLGDVPQTSVKSDHFIKDIDNSSVAEAFRYIRTNINFMLDNKEACKTVFVTSTQSEEGKTFTAINLASSLAISGKKTLLIGMDLRAPKINKYLDLEDLLGVTNYIKNENLSLKEITEKYTSIHQLHLINSGDIPPNPVELLMSKRVDQMFEEAKKVYDYIIVDTAPVGMVTDTMQISKYADLTIYVVKSNFLDKRMLHIPEKLFKEKKLMNMAMLINGTDHSRGAYGYGYGYGKNKKKNILQKYAVKLGF